MPNVFVNSAGAFTAAKEIFVNSGGVWSPAKEIWVNNAGTWQKAFPESSGSNNYTTPGTSTFVVPNGVYALSNIRVVGAGGGGGGATGSGDNHAGGGGGSGGYLTGQSLSVTPGDVITIEVGAGGASGTFDFNGGLICLGTAGRYVYAGQAGQQSRILKNGSQVFVATGGGGGYYSVGDSCSAYSGAGGSPNGVAGGAVNCTRNNYGATPGGNNGTGYGSGGQSHSSSGACTTVGGNGNVYFTW